MDEMPVFMQWMDFLKWLMPVTDKFPKKYHFTFSNRIDNLALDIVEDLVEARYTKDKTAILRRANLRVERIRVLLRLAHELKILSHDGHEHAAKAMTEVGRMLGGWMRERQGHPGVEVPRSTRT
jgi:hypothetical protein